MLTISDIPQNNSGSQTPFTVNRDRYLAYKQARLAKERIPGGVNFETVSLRQRMMEISNNILFPVVGKK